MLPYHLSSGKWSEQGLVCGLHLELVREEGLCEGGTVTMTSASVRHNLASRSEMFPSYISRVSSQL